MKVKVRVVADLMGASFVQLDVEIEKVKVSWEEFFVQVDIKIEIVVADLGEDLDSNCGQLISRCHPSQLISNNDDKVFGRAVT